MSSEAISMVAGTLISLMFSYVPGVKDQFEELTSTGKRAWLCVFILVVGVSSFIFGCAGLSDVVSCDKSGASGLIRSVMLALIANQTAYIISPASSKKKENNG